MTFGIINSNSNPEEKAESIWNAYDVDFNDELPVKAIKTLLEDIFECSVDVVDTLFKEGIDDHKSDYFANLTMRKKSFLVEVFSKF